MGVAGQRHAGKHPVRTVQEIRWASGQVCTGTNTSKPPPPRLFEPRTIQPVASRYTECTIPPSMQLTSERSFRYRITANRQRPLYILIEWSSPSVTTFTGPAFLFESFLEKVSSVRLDIRGTAPSPFVSSTQRSDAQICLPHVRWTACSANTAGCGRRLLQCTDDNRTRQRKPTFHSTRPSENLQTLRGPQINT